MIGPLTHKLMLSAVGFSVLIIGAGSLVGFFSGVPFTFSRNGNVIGTAPTTAVALILLAIVCIASAFRGDK